MCEADSKPNIETNVTCYDGLRDDVEDILKIVSKFSKLRENNSEYYRDFENNLCDMEKEHFNLITRKDLWGNFYEEECRKGRENIDETEKEFLEIKLREIIKKHMS